MHTCHSNLSLGYPWLELNDAISENISVVTACSNPLYNSRAWFNIVLLHLFQFVLASVINTVGDLVCYSIYIANLETHT